jgi:2-dehydro-3-deoxyphosphogluconate aldolase / (4S)-4-hydroxy-2-oxoglutarate aldolase
MDIYEIKAKLSKHGVIPVIAIENELDALPLADALIAGGLPLIEITFRTSVASAVMAEISKERPEMLLGAGTILTTDELKKAVDSGATFGVAPGFNPIIVEEALKNNFPFMPGIMTPSDLEGALSLGVQNFKFFPAEATGGVKYLSSISAPYSHKQITFIPTGGINLSNLIEYLSLDTVIAVGGTWIAKSADIRIKAWESITSKCKEARKIIDK